MKCNSNIIKMAGMAGMLLAGLATLVSNWTQQKVMEETIEEKVNEALAKKENEKESE